MLSLIWRPAASPLQIAAGAALLAGLAVLAYARSARGGRVVNGLLLAMRLAVIAALATILMGPSRLPEQSRRPGRPPLRVLVDTSASMLTDDAQGGARIEDAAKRWLAPDLLERIKRHYDVKVIGFDAGLHNLTPQQVRQAPTESAVGRQSRVADAVRQTIDGVASHVNDAVVLLLSDGHDSEGERLASAAALAKARGVNVHTVTFGGPALQRDLAMVAFARQPYLLAKEPGEITARIYQGGLENAQTTLRLELPDGGEVTREVVFQDGQPVAVTLPIQQDKPGMHEYRLTLDAVPGEVEHRNNKQSVFVEVTDEHIKVLVLEGEPYWDTKFLAQSLRKDARIELTQVTQLSPSKRETIITRAGDPEAARDAPDDVLDFARYDVVLLGSRLENALDEVDAQALVNYVSKRDGHVVFCRGRAYDPGSPDGRRIGGVLAEIEPVIFDRGLARDVRLALAEAGRGHAVFSFAGLSPKAGDIFEQLPGFSSMPVVTEAKPGARVLAHGLPDSFGGETKYPAVVVMPYGGQVVGVLGEGLHRWSFLPPELKQYDGVYDAFWSNLVRWLVMGGQFQPSQQVSLTISGTSVRLGDSLDIGVATKYAPDADFQPTLRITGPDGAPVETATHTVGGMPNKLRAGFTPKQTGVHTVTLDTPGMQPPTQTKKFNVYHIDLERLEPSANPTGMQALAEQSGGLAWRPDQADEFAMTLQRLLQAQIVPRRPEYVWPQGLIMSVLLLWVGVEWIMRRQAGLL